MISILYAMSIVINFAFEKLTEKFEVFGIDMHIALLFLAGNIISNYDYNLIYIYQNFRRYCLNYEWNNFHEMWI